MLNEVAALFVAAPRLHRPHARLEEQRQRAGAGQHPGQGRAGGRFPHHRPGGLRLLLNVQSARRHHLRTTRQARGGALHRRRSRSRRGTSPACSACPTIRSSRSSIRSAAARCPNSRRGPRSPTSRRCPSCCRPDAYLTTSAALMPVASMRACQSRRWLSISAVSSSDERGFDLEAERLQQLDQLAVLDDRAQPAVQLRHQRRGRAGRREEGEPFLHVERRIAEFLRGRNAGSRRTGAGGPSS